MRALVLAQALILLASFGIPMAALAVISSVTPDNMNQGASGSITITTPSATFTGGSTVYTVTFSGTGVTATNVVKSNSFNLTADVTVTAGATPGPRTVTVSGTGGFVTQTYDFFTVNAAKLNQATLTITGPATRTYGDIPFAPVTSGGSGTGAVTFTSSTPSVCTASGSATVTIVTVGTCTVTATKAADATYNATTSAPFSITIGQASSTTVVTCPVSVPYTGSAQTPCTVAVTGAGGLSLTPSATYSNNTNVGTATASYTFAGDANYTSAATRTPSLRHRQGRLPSTVVTCARRSVHLHAAAAQTPCSAAVTGAGGLSLTRTVDYIGQHQCRHGHARAADYAGDANHNPSSDSHDLRHRQGRLPSRSSPARAGPFTYTGCGPDAVLRGRSPAPAASTRPLTVDYIANTDAGTATAIRRLRGRRQLQPEQRLARPSTSARPTTDHGRHLRRRSVHLHRLRPRRRAPRWSPAPAA